ncbi:hypothetical protein F4801DRAFT_563808 [Xylaria longipes]|nr:hypothetical protein F4801DRAFT_563808 [Xylaria longipes]
MRTKLYSHYYPGSPSTCTPPLATAFLYKGNMMTRLWAFQRSVTISCLFIIGDGPSLSDDVACLADLVKLHLESGWIYRTILQSSESPQPDENGEFLYNLWQPYRPHTKRGGNELKDWLMELQSKRRITEP